jgi:transcriptional regulator with XRE-family HTH domain
MTKSLFSDRYDQFRRLLIEARTAKDLSQRDLALRLDRPQSYVSKYERGERRLDVIEFLQIAETLEIDPFAFLTQLKAIASQTVD